MNIDLNGINLKQHIILSKCYHLVNLGLMRKVKIYTGHGKENPI